MATGDVADASRRERKKAETRARIVASASRLFIEKGYEATSMRDITDAADVASRTFYLHFTSKADVALAQFHDWLSDLTRALVDRPEDETPLAMLRGALGVLRDKGYMSSFDLRDEDDRPLAPIIASVILAESSPDIAGRVYQSLAQAETVLTGAVRHRLGLPESAIEPRIIASAIFAIWFATIHSFADLLAAGVHPPTFDELTLTAFEAYYRGLHELWDSSGERARKPRPRGASKGRGAAKGAAPAKSPAPAKGRSPSKAAPAPRRSGGRGTGTSRA